MVHEGSHLVFRGGVEVGKWGKIGLSGNKTQAQYATPLPKPPFRGVGGGVNSGVMLARWKSIEMRWGRSGGQWRWFWM
jgi:hypothetical protein